MDQSVTQGIGAIIAGMRRGGAISDECLGFIMEELAALERRSSAHISQPVAELAAAIGRATGAR